MTTNFTKSMIFGYSAYTTNVLISCYPFHIHCNGFHLIALDLRKRKVNDLKIESRFGMYFLNDITHVFLVAGSTLVAPFLHILLIFICCTVNSSPGKKISQTLL